MEDISEQQCIHQSETFKETAFTGFWDTISLLFSFDCISSTASMWMFGISCMDVLSLNGRSSSCESDLVSWEGGEECQTASLHHVLPLWPEVEVSGLRSTAKEQDIGYGARRRGTRVRFIHIREQKRRFRARTGFPFGSPLLYSWPKWGHSCSRSHHYHRSVLVFWQGKTSLLHPQRYKHLPWKMNRQINEWMHIRPEESLKMNRKYSGYCLLYLLSAVSQAPTYPTTLS